MDPLEDWRDGKTWQSWNSGSFGPSLQVAMPLKDAVRTYEDLGTYEILLLYLVDDNIHKNSPHLKHQDINTHQIYLERVSTLKCPNAEGRRYRSVCTTNQEWRASGTEDGETHSRPVHERISVRRTVYLGHARISVWCLELFFRAAVEIRQFAPCISQHTSVTTT